jgi:cytochrome c2
LLLAMAVGCGSEGGDAATDQPVGEMEQMEQPPMGEAEAMEAPTGEIDAALASEGEGYFQSKGCVGCHAVGGGRMIGPDLQGVTERRGYEWTVAMIVRPDSMLQNDAQAQALLEEYGTPMVSMGVTREEAHAMYEYLRRQSQ